MRGNACSVSSFIRSCVLSVCIVCVCVCVGVFSLLKEVMMMDGGQKRDWGSCVLSQSILWQTPLHSMHFFCGHIPQKIQGTYQYQKHNWLLCFDRKHTFIILTKFLLSVVSGSSLWVCLCVLVFFFFYICAFPWSFGCLWADSCVAMVLSTDVAVYNETVPHSLPCSPCCEAVYIRLLSQAGPEVIRSLTVTLSLTLMTHLKWHPA